MSTEYEYRPLMRLLPDGEWRQISTAGSSWGKRPYVTRGAAAGVVSREKRVNADNRHWATQVGRTPTDFEYKIQRRPLGDWEDLPETG